MKNLMRQFFTTFHKKTLLIITLFLSIFVTVFVTATLTAAISSIQKSKTNIVNKSIGSESLVSTNKDSKTIKFNVEKDINGNILFEKINNIISINSNGTFDLLDEKMKNKDYNPYLANQFVIFPFAKNEIITKKEIDKSNINSYINLKPFNILKSFQNIDNNIKYAVGMSLFDSDKVKKFDFRNISFENTPNEFYKIDNETKNIYDMNGLWNNGSYNDPKASINIYKYINENENEKSTNIIYRENENEKISRLEFWNEWKLNDLLISNKNLWLTKDIDNNFAFRDYVNDLPQLNEKEGEKLGQYVPYIQTDTPGIRFTYKIDKSQLDKSGQNFYNYLSLNHPTYLESHLDLTNYQLLGISQNEFNKKTPKEQGKIKKNALESINNYETTLNKNFNEYKNEFINSEIGKQFQQFDFKYILEDEFYYSDSKNKKDFIISKKTTEQNINKLVINKGVSLNSNYLSKDAILASWKAAEDKNGLQTTASINQFLEVFKETNYIKRATKLLIQKNINFLKNHPLISVEDFCNSTINPFYKDLFLKTYFAFKKDNLNINFYCEFNRGFSDLILNRKNSELFLLKDNITYLTSSYFDNNNLGYIPETSFLKDAAKPVIPNEKPSEKPIIPKPKPKTRNVYKEPLSYKYILSAKDLVDKNSKLKEKNWTLNNYIDQLPKKYIFNFYEEKFLIAGSASSFDFIYPIVNIETPIPNTINEGVSFFSSNAFNYLVNYAHISSTNQYYALKSNIHLSKSKLNKKLKVLSTNLNNIGNFQVNNVTKGGLDSNPLISLRYTMPDKVVDTITTICIILIVMLLLMNFYIIFLLLKTLINSIKNSVAICIANGFSTWKIIGAIFIPIVVFALIATSIAYLSSFFATQTILGSFGTIWFVSLNALSFSPIIFFSSLILITVIIGLITSIYVYFKFKKNVLEILNNSEEIKINFLTRILRKNNKKTSAFTKLNFGFFTSKYPKLIILWLLASFTLGIGATSISLNNKLSVSWSNTQKAKKYEFAINLDSPTEASGLYKKQTLSEIGTTNESIGINSSMENIPTPYVDLLKQDKSIFALRQWNGTSYEIPKTNIQYFTNYLLPSFNMYKLLESDPNIFFNQVVSIFLIDINFPGVGNIWENFVRPLFPQKLVYSITQNSVEFKNKIFNHPHLGPLFEKFLVKDITGKPKITDGSYTLDSKKIIYQPKPMNYYNIRYEIDFLKFLGKLFSEKELVQEDIKLTMGNIPYVEDWNETYTYVDALMNNSKNIELLGISDNSKFIHLINKKNEDLFSKINYPSDNLPKRNEQINIVINNGAKIEYKLKKNDTFSLQVKNDYYRNSYKIMKNLYPDNPAISSPTWTFKVVGISEDSIGSKFYLDQEVANKITNLNQGELITVANNEKIEKMRYQEVQNYVPFNGLFTNQTIPTLGNKIISCSTNDGLYGIYFEFNEYNSNLLTKLPTLANLLTTNIDLLKLYETDHNLLKTLFENRNQDTTSLLALLNSVYDGKQTQMSITNMNSKSLTDNLYNVISQLVFIIELIFIILFIPILLLTIVVSTSNIIDELKKTLIMLSILGFSRWKIIQALFSSFIPVVLLSIGVGIGIIFAIAALLTHVLFDISTIYIPIALAPTIIITAVGVFILTFLIIGIVVSLKLLTMNKNEAIK